MHAETVVQETARAVLHKFASPTLQNLDQVVRWTPTAPLPGHTVSVPMPSTVSGLCRPLAPSVQAWVNTCMHG